MMLEMVPQRYKPSDHDGKTFSSSFDDDDENDDGDEADGDNHNNYLKPLVNTTCFRPQEQATLSWRPTLPRSSRKCCDCCGVRHRRLLFFLSPSTLYRCSLSLNVLLLAILLYIVMIAFVLSPLDDSSSPSSSIQFPDTTTAFGYNNNNNNDNTATNSSSLLVYGHLHMANTAGIEINGRLASQFERVCGNRGYSYDAFQVNLRNNNINNNHDDLISKSYHQGYHRGRVPAQVMAEIGYEDCDYISQEEGNWSFWNEIFADNDDHNGNTNNNSHVHRFQDDIQIELHVPCVADPLKHVLSLCYHNNDQESAEVTNFTNAIIDSCDNEDNDGGEDEDDDNNDDDDVLTALLADLIADCPLLTDRFSMSLLPSSQPDNKLQRVSCFSPIPVDPYIRYMSQRLQSRRIRVDYYKYDDGDYDGDVSQKGIKEMEGTTVVKNDGDDNEQPQPPSSIRKNKGSAIECLYELTELTNRLRQYLVENHDYYKFCNECMGSEHELELT